MSFNCFEKYVILKMKNMLKDVLFRHINHKPNPNPTIEVTLIPTLYDYHNTPVFAITLTLIILSKVRDLNLNSTPLYRLSLTVP